MKKGLIFAFAFVLLFVSLSSVRAAMCVPGTINVMAVDGYVDDTTGTRLEGAYVLGTTTCSMPATNGGVLNGLTYPNGYYTLFNLPLITGSNVNMVANYTHPTYGAGRGIRNKISSGSVQNINITVCYPPSPPSITDIDDTHFTVIRFDWVSGVDPVGYTTYDELVINGATERASTGIEKTLSTNRDYDWSVRTCNQPPTGMALNDVFCCSAYVSDEFHIGNEPPSPPNGTGAGSGGVTTLSWTSGIDPENDPTYDQFRFVGGVTVGNLTNPATSPRTLPTELLTSWEIRTCDNFNACSVWVRIDTVTCPAAPSCPPPGGGGGGGGGNNCPVCCVFGNYTPTVVEKSAEIYCDGVKQDAGMVTKVEFKTSTEGVKLVAYGNNYAVQGAEYCPSCYDGKKDAGETDVDCGGSCKACSPITSLAKKSNWLYWLLGLLLLALVLLIMYLERQNFYLWRIYKLINKGRVLVGLEERGHLMVAEKKEKIIDKEPFRLGKDRKKGSGWFRNMGDSLAVWLGSLGDKIKNGWNKIFHKSKKEYNGGKQWSGWKVSS